MDGAEVVLVAVFQLRSTWLAVGRCSRGRGQHEKASMPNGLLNGPLNGSACESFVAHLVL